jgi:hypothetical protein
MALESEKLKVELSRTEEERKIQHQALAEFAKEFAVAYQRSAHILWLVEMRAPELKPENFGEYDRESKTHFPTLVAAQVMLAAHSKELHDAVVPQLRAYWALHERISVAGNRFATDREDALKDLNREVSGLRAFEEKLISSISAANERAASRAASK